MQAFKCLKRVSEGCLEKWLFSARQTARHLSDTWRNKSTKTAIYKCLAKCLMVSDSLKIVTVCLAACPLDAPNQTPQTQKQERDRK